MWWAGNCSITESLPELIQQVRQDLAGAPGGKIIIYMPSAPLLVPYQEFSTSSTGPANRYQIHMLTGPYLLFRNQLIGNKGSYWVVQILWLRAVLLEITYISKLLSSTL